MSDRDNSFLKPLWRRVALVAFCAAWAAWEAWNGEAFWAVIVGAMAVYGVWTFLIDYDRAPAGNGGSDHEQKP